VPLRVALNFADGHTRFVDVHEHETLVEAALRNAIVLPVDCREGVCATCRGVCVAGEYDLQFVHEDALSGAELAEGAVLSCQMRPRTDCVVRFDFDSALSLRTAPQGVHRARLRSIERVSPAVSIVELELEPDANLQYLPGQYAHLRVPGTNACRSYSFANAPNGAGRLRFVVRMLPRGEMSDYLRTRAATGDAIDLEGPFGSFYLRRRTRPVLMLAGGTGLSAFLGMVEQLQAAPPTGQAVTLLYGVTDAADFCELGRLLDCAAANPDFGFRTIAVQAPPHWQGRLGVVTDLLDEVDLNGGQLDVYVCGPPPMVAATYEAFRSRQLDVRIHAEKFAAS
jgi:anthranilate 1,2-dioxygenase reductase subunit